MGVEHSITGSWLIALITIVDACNSCWFGYDQGVFAGVLVSPDFLRVFPTTKDANVNGLTSSCFFLGAGVGAIAAFVLGDKLGRRKTIALGLFCNAVGAILQTLSWQLAQMITGRLVNGFGIGLVSTMSPVYLSECVKSHVRGMLMGIGTCCNVLCFCIANWISYGLYYQNNAFQWRFPLGFQLIFLIILTPIWFMVPESPRWLLLVDRDAEALQVLSKLIGHGKSIEDEEVLAEFRSIKVAINEERADRVPISDVLRHRDKTQNFRRVILSCGSQFMQQFTGINAWGFYFPTLLQEFVGYNQQMSRLITAASGTVYLVCAMVCLLLIDRFGRRKLLMYPPFFIGVVLLIAALCLQVAENDESRKQLMGRVATSMIILYHVFFGLGFAISPWVYSAEVNSLGWRARGAAAATTVNWLGGFVVVQITKVGLDHLKWRFFLMFAILSLAMSPVVYLFYPETANRTLEDMDQIFINHKSVFVFANRDATQSQRPQLFIEAEKLRIAQSANASQEFAVPEGSEKKPAGRVAVATAVVEV